MVAVDGEHAARGDKAGDVPELTELHDSRNGIARAMPQGAIRAHIVGVCTTRNRNRDALIGGGGMQCRHSATRVAQHQHGIAVDFGKRQSPVEDPRQIPHPFAQHGASRYQDLPAVTATIPSVMPVGDVRHPKTPCILPDAAGRRRNRQEPSPCRLYGYIPIFLLHPFARLCVARDTGLQLSAAMSMRGHRQRKRPATLRGQHPELNLNVRLRFDPSLLAKARSQIFLFRRDLDLGSMSLTFRRDHRQSQQPPKRLSGRRLPRIVFSTCPSAAFVAPSLTAVQSLKVLLDVLRMLIHLSFPHFPPRTYPPPTAA